MIDLDATRDAIADYLQPLYPNTMAFAKTPREVHFGARTPLVAEEAEIELDAEKPQFVLDFFSIEPGDEMGQDVLTNIVMGSNSPAVESGLYMQRAMFCLWLFKDARVFSRDDIINQLKVYNDKLLEEHTLSGVTRTRWFDPEIPYVSIAPDEESDFMFYVGILKIGYEREITVEER